MVSSTLLHRQWTGSRSMFRSRRLTGCSMRISPSSPTPRAANSMCGPCNIPFQHRSMVMSASLPLRPREESRCALFQVELNLDSGFPNSDVHARKYLFRKLWSRRAPYLRTEPLPQAVVVSNFKFLVLGRSKTDPLKATMTPNCLQALYNIPTTAATSKTNRIGVVSFVEQWANNVRLFASWADISQLTALPTNSRQTWPPFSERFDRIFLR